MPQRYLVRDTENAHMRIDLAAGGRIARLAVAGYDLLVGGGPDPIEWGCYPMAPWAGRLRRGRFAFGGAEHRLPKNFGAHAIHGTVFDARWEASGGDLVARLGPPWPWPGEVRQRLRLEPGRLHLLLEVHAARDPMPASCGWHPWFRRDLGGGPVALEFAAGHMLRRDAEGIASAEQVAVPAGPWDDCFGAVTWPVVLAWPELRLEIESTCNYLVVYDERDHAVCVEPQTAPPDALNRRPFVVEPGRPLVAESTWSWEAA